MQLKITDIIKKIDRFEDWLLVLMVSAMVLMAVAQIVYRNVFGAGLIWGDALLRVMVLWVALSGAVIATRMNNHIRIDFFTRYFSKRFNNFVQRLVFSFSLIVCAIIAWHSARFVYMDYEYNTIAFANVPAWTTELILPLGFFLMAVRYFLLFLFPPKPERY